MEDPPATSSPSSGIDDSDPRRGGDADGRPPPPVADCVLCGPFFAATTELSQAVAAGVSEVVGCPGIGMAGMSSGSWYMGGRWPPIEEGG